MTAPGLGPSGDPAAIAELLAPIVSIGKKRGAGNGRVLSWTASIRG